MSAAVTETVIAVAEVDAPRPATARSLAATLARAVAAQRGPVALTIEAVPFPAALERQHIALLVTFRPEQLPGRAAEQVCNYVADVALPGLRREHGVRARLTITPVDGAAAAHVYRLLGAGSFVCWSGDDIVDGDRWRPGDNP